MHNLLVLQNNLFFVYLKGSTSASGNIIQIELHQRSVMLGDVTIHFLENITDHFSEECIVGIGRYGNVYKVYMTNVCTFL